MFLNRRHFLELTAGTGMLSILQGYGSTSSKPQAPPLKEGRGQAVSHRSEVTLEKLEKYVKVTENAIKLAEKSGNRTPLVKGRGDCLDMIKRYFSDALHFKKKGKFVNAFAALNYAHGWLDACARIGIFDVHDSKLFTVD